LLVKLFTLPAVFGLMNKDLQRRPKQTNTL